MSFFARRNPEAAALAVQVPALTTELAALTARLAVQAPAPVLTIDGKSGHYVLKRSVHERGAGYTFSYGEQWRYVTKAGTLTSKSKDAEKFVSPTEAMQRAVTLEAKDFALPAGTTDTGSWKIGHVHAVWKED